MTIEKASLRAQMKQQLTNIPESEKKRQADAIIAKLHNFLAGQSGYWTLFAPLADEPNLLKLVSMTPETTWVFPKIKSNTEMEFVTVSTPDLMAWNLLTEDSDFEVEGSVAVEELSGCLVPGLGFDHQGVRLGRGGGYYDRCLENFRGLKLGVTFTGGIVKQALPRE